MSTKTAIAAVKTHLNSGWATAVATIPDFNGDVPLIAFPKEPFTPEDGKCWLFFDPDTSRPTRTGMGSTVAARGNINIHVMTPSDAGSDDYASSLRDVIETIFDSKQFGGIQTDVVANIPNSGSAEDQSFSMSTVRIEWRQLYRR